MRLRLPRIVARSKAQIFVEAIRIDELARIHLPIGIPKRFELAEGLHQFRAKHLRQKLAARLPVSMLTRDGATVADYEVGGLFHKLAEFSNAFRRFEIVIHARVDAGMTEMSVERTVVVMRLHELAQVAQDHSQFIGA